MEELGSLGLGRRLKELKVGCLQFSEESEDRCEEAGWRLLLFGRSHKKRMTMERYMIDINR